MISEQHRLHTITDENKPDPRAQLDQLTWIAWLLRGVRFFRETADTPSSSATRSQSYDRELQRQRCKNLQRNYVIAYRVFRIKIIFPTYIL
jgi:hypothetical protein